MATIAPDISDSLKAELYSIWFAHRSLGLDGQMCLYSQETQEPWRSDKPGVKFWFDASQIDQAIEFIAEHYNEGNLPNTTLLLNPVVHSKPTDGSEPKPLGSAILWCSPLALGVDRVGETQQQRLENLGIFAKLAERGEIANSGLKVLAFLKKPVKPNEKGEIAECKALYDLTNIKSDDFYSAYILSGLAYLTRNGSYKHPSFFEFFKPAELADTVKLKAIDAQLVLDAAKCWNAYDRSEILFDKFGVDPDNIESNLRYFNLCSRDIQLVESLGPKARVTGKEGRSGDTLEFLVPGWIPMGGITLIAAAGGTGKSSAAHHLAVMASIDWREDEHPKWLGQPVNKDMCTGINVYFSGEDGPAIINARAALFDPEGRSRRIMFQRTDFGEGQNLSTFLRRLKKLPDVPLLVIDPARKYLTGDEDDAGVVSEFFEAIEEFAIDKNAAVVVVHHLAKGSKPQTTREVLDCLRGSQVFIDRPRVVIGMYRDGPYTVAGLAKNNIPPSMGMVMEERVFARDPDSLQLLWLPGEKGIRKDFLDAEELAQLRGEEG